MSNMGPMLVWIVVLVVAVVAGGIAVSVMRRRLFEDEEGDGDMALTLNDLRKMRRSGQINEEEFAKLKAGMLASMGYGKEGGSVEDPEGRGGREGFSDG